MADVDEYAQVHHWGDQAIDTRARDLPALKARYLVDHLPHTGRVLEIGCGGGRLLKTIAAHRPQLELYGCDVRPLARAPAAFQFRLLEPDGVSLPYEPESFDAVILFDALEHFPDPAISLRAARAVLHPAGRLVSFTPLEAQPLSFYRFYRRLLGDDVYVHTKGHVHAFSESALTALLAPDFRVVDKVYAYHVLGHLMDATLYAALKAPRFHRRYWRDNPYYAEEPGSAIRPRRGLLATALRGANAVAYTESRILRGRRQGAAGILFVAVAREH